MEFTGEMTDDDLYELKYLDEVVKLRWLITRQPAAVELRYYLLFMLVAHKRYAKAAEECRRILASHPNDMIAQFWLAKLKERDYEEPSTRSNRQLGPPDERAGTAPKYCDRCTRRSSSLEYDDLSLRNLCPDCRQDLARRRIVRKPASR